MRSDVSLTRFDAASTQAALDAVLVAVSEFNHTDATELRRLDRYINPDVINLLFGGPGTSTTHIEEGSLSFRYDDVFVTVTHDGWIEVVDTDAFRARPTSMRFSTEVHAHQSPEAELDVAATALAEAEEHIWTAANNMSEAELVDPLWAIVELLWDAQISLHDTMSQSSSTESPMTRTDGQR